ncbi:hypothetical protein ABZ820_39070 [Streptomyces diacarni]|uniref:hypothetical protein n=1 Tax=Streptomyces diacarni TaxID=2800381 RepID=UPI0033E6663A
MKRRLRETPVSQRNGKIACIDSKVESSEVKGLLAGVAVPETRCSYLEAETLYYWRDAWCLKHVVRYQIVLSQSEKVVGEAIYGVQTELTMGSKLAGPPEIKDHMDVTLLKEWGEAIGSSAHFASWCSTCTTKDYYPWSGYRTFAEGETVGKDPYRSVPVPAGGTETVDWDYTLSVKAPKFAALSPSWGAGWIKGRCDNKVAGNFGCIVPTATPTLGLDVAKDKAGALFVHRSMTENNQHWGLEGKGKPLTRLADADAAESNRDIICPDSWPRDQRVQDPSCDEFPFARTYQSGAQVGVKNGNECEQRTTVQVDDFLEVPPVDGNGLPVDEGDPDAPCVRATTPLKENSGVGGELGNFTKKMRLLDEDSYWVYVYDSSLS